MTLDIEPTPVPHHANPDIDPTATYQLFTYNVPYLGSATQEVLFEATGDHLFVAECNASNAIWVKLGSRRNPWLRVRQGDTLRRRFTRFWVKGHLEGDEFSSNQTAVFYASVGTLIDRPVIDRGLHRGFVCFGGTTSAVGNQMLRGFIAASLASSSSQQSVGRLGGILYLANLDTTNWLQFFYTTTGSVLGVALTQMMGVPPNQYIRLDLHDSLFVPPNTGIGASLEEGIGIAGATPAAVRAAVPFRGLLTPMDMDYTIQPGDPFLTGPQYLFTLDQ